MRERLPQAPRGIASRSACVTSSVVGVAGVAVPVALPPCSCCGAGERLLIKTPSLLGDSVGGVDGDSCCRAGEVDAGDAGRATAGARAWAGNASAWVKSTARIAILRCTRTSKV